MKLYKFAFYAIALATPWTASNAQEIKNDGTPSFEHILELKFSGQRDDDFKKLEHWAENLSPSELARWKKKIELSNGTTIWQTLGCDEAISRGLTRAMMVTARQSKNRQDAIDLWNRIIAAEKKMEGSVRAAQALLISSSGSSTRLGRQLAKRAAIDQAWRSTLTLQPVDEELSAAYLWKTWERGCKIDQDNQQFLKAVIAEQGWPAVSVHGTKASSDALLLVQHADNDPEFQMMVLNKLKLLLPKKEVSGKDYALLFDRVALAQNRPQRYGTQFGLGKGDCIAARPTENPTKVDKLRADVGLTSLKEYAAKLEKEYGLKGCDNLFDTADPLLVE